MGGMSAPLHALLSPSSKLSPSMTGVLLFLGRWCQTGVAFSDCSKQYFYFRCYVVVVSSSASSRGPLEIILRTLNRIVGLQVHSQSPRPQLPLDLQTPISLNELSASPLHWAFLTLCVLLSEDLQPSVSLNGFP